MNAKLPFKELFNLHIATGYLPFIDFNYDYFEEVRGISFGDPLLAYNTIKSSGQIYAIPFVIAAEPMEKLSVGFGVNVLNGSIEYLERVESKNAQTAGVSAEYETKAELTNTPVLFQLGANYQVNERWGVAATYRSAYSLETENTYRFLQLPDKLFSENTLDYPGRIGIGTNYRFENILAAQIFVDYYYEFWSDFKDNLNPQLSFEDTYTINMGIEHIFFDGLPFRVGFSYGTLREGRDFSKSVISAGSGFTFESVTFNLAAGFSSLEFFQDDIYDNANYGLETRDDPDRVRWSELFGRLDISFYLQ